MKQEAIFPVDIGIARSYILSVKSEGVMSVNSTSRLLSVVAAGLLSTAAHAQEVRGVTVPLGVYDANNNWVGTYSWTDISGNSYVIRPYGQPWYQFQFNSLEITANAVFYYQGTGCVGQKFAGISDAAIPELLFDGTALWSPGNSSEKQAVAVQSYSNNGSCYSYSTPYNAALAPAVEIDPKAGTEFVPPFTVR